MLNWRIFILGLHQNRIKFMYLYFPVLHRGLDRSLPVGQWTIFHFRYLVLFKTKNKPRDSVGTNIRQRNFLQKCLHEQTGDLIKHLRNLTIFIVQVHTTDINEELTYVDITNIGCKDYSLSFSYLIKNVLSLQSFFAKLVTNQSTRNLLSIIYAEFNFIG